jgi:hypothetical protein
VKRTWATPAVLLVLLGVAEAQTRFSSAYTDLNTQCESQEIPGDQSGSDPPVICKGYGGYMLRISYSAISAGLSADKGSNISVSIATVEGNYDAQKGRKLEWRLAGGVPFAVILRVNQYNPASDAINPYDPKYRTGSRLRVVGLAGFERVRGEVDTNQAKANEKARALADAKYKTR